MRPSHGLTPPAGRKLTREDRQYGTKTINNINMTPHETTTIRPQNPDTSSVTQQALRETYKPNTSIGYFNSRMPATAVNSRGPSLDPVSQPRVSKSTDLINQ